MSNELRNLAVNIQLTAASGYSVQVGYKSKARTHEDSIAVLFEAIDELSRIACIAGVGDLLDAKIADVRKRVAADLETT